MERTCKGENGRREYKGKQIRCLGAHYQHNLEQDNKSVDVLSHLHPAYAVRGNMGAVIPASKETATGDLLMSSQCRGWKNPFPCL